MSMLHSLATQTSAQLARDVIIVALVILAAVLATVIFSGGAQPLSFNITTDPMGVYPW
jgi:hypothetical protein